MVPMLVVLAAILFALEANLGQTPIRLKLESNDHVHVPDDGNHAPCTQRGNSKIGPRDYHSLQMSFRSPRGCLLPWLHPSLFVLPKSERWLLE